MFRLQQWGEGVWSGWRRLADTDEMQTGSTVAAIATASGPASIAVIRISGPQAWSIAVRLFCNRARQPVLLKPGHVRHGWFVEPRLLTHQPEILLDEGLLLCFKAPHSFTGEDVVELHCHGGAWVPRRLLDWCVRLGAEPAGPGEFTKRALLNGRLDLTQAESIMDVIGSQGAAMAQVALHNLRYRSLHARLSDLLETLAQVQAQIVASVDFPDEVEEPERSVLLTQLRPLRVQVDHWLEVSQRNRLLRDGMTVAILGLPNSGKSSLFNALLVADRAIVSEEAGTTRDVLTEALLLDGIPITLVDTAGIRETDSRIEILGIERSWQAASDATGILYLYDASVGLLREDRRILGVLQARLPGTPILLVANKVDSVPGKLNLPGNEVFQISTKTGEGLPALTRWLNQLLSVKGPDQQALADGAMCLNQRQTDCLADLQQQLTLAIETLEIFVNPLDLASFPLTQALRAGERLFGKDTTESVLDSVFSRFCVGK